MNEFKRSTVEEVLSVLESGSRPSGGVDTESGTIPSLGGENINQDGRMFYGVIKKVHDSFYQNMPRGHLLPYDVLINKDGAQTGKVAIYKGDFPHAAINEHLFLMRGKPNVIEQKFLCYYLIFEATQHQVIKMITGSAQPGINSGFTKYIIIDIPPIESQRRIAEILDTIEETIQKTEALISKLKAMKQGLLHDLLTRGLDKNGKLRDPKAHPEQFKEFGLRKVPRSWTVGKLGTQLTFQRGFDITQTEQRPGNVPVVSSSGITSYHDRAMVNGPGVVTGRKGKLGQAYFIESSFWPHDTTLWVKNFHENIPRFAALFIEWLRLERFDAATSVPTLNRNFIHPMIVAMPPEYEQRQICAMAESFNNRIRTEEQYRDKLKLQKKGLMHDLLTGKVRVKV
ncbi:MAG: restriction endonuclease subunit S [Deltaproteobacteria bacterium]|nr:restriction endonuclease subunit S [Deltaproteobacteria bacterium]MBW1728147.1 restriction endonuclease subunit S [Deltaproteobacteria bacterium]MBW1909365.1 restriction endonuclease subunit S [Deltaproteobacteria bacterium]MBW2034379.1 restriction endonuclease subunit S [Deltaproteobacteria bacterium]MBW2115335.1 restriction endonuclease subunit S [Deltaproteobacteria bacterium]